MHLRQSPLASSALSLASLHECGSGLNRPECVLAHSSGLLFVSDWGGQGGIAVIAPDSAVKFIRAIDPPRPLRPNGIALEPNGNFLLADLGSTEGGVWRLHSDGRVEAVLTEVGGYPLPPTNFIYRDLKGRLWISVSTRRIPRHLGYRRDIADGFIVMLDNCGARVVADGLGYTNECMLSPAEDYLYANETFARRLSRFRVLPGGNLGARETFVEFGEGTFPDGLTFDDEGAIWVTSIVSNRVLRIDAERRVELVIEDTDSAHITWVETAFRDGELGRPHLDRAAGRVLRNISSLAFGGDDLRTGYLGCLIGETIAAFRSPVAGLPQPHWNASLGPLVGWAAPRPDQNTERLQ